MQLCIFVIVKQYLIVGIPTLCHHGGTYLAKSYSMSPPCAIKGKTCGHTINFLTALNGEGGAVKMTFGKGTANFKFLTDGELLLRAYDAQFLNTPTGAALYGLQVEDSTKIFLTTLSKQFCQLVLRVIHAPTVEILRFTIVIIEHL